VLKHVKSEKLKQRRYTKKKNLVQGF